MARDVLIQIMCGLEMNIGTLNIGELGYCTDTKKLYIGTVSGNELLVAAQTAGDMLKSIYDTDNDGVVDAAETVPWSGVTGKKSFPASTIGEASLNIPHGTAPTAPVNGDVWTTTSAILVRINGTTKTIALTDTWSTVTQAEAEAGTATTARLWTAQRVLQAIQANATKKAPLTWGDLKGV
jgi:hypothetical protein